MAWFAWQSALFILLAFVLGCLVGYWYWRIQFRRAAFTESEAVTVISRRHEKTIAEKDAEIGRLQAVLASGTGASAATDTATAADLDGDAEGEHPAAVTDSADGRSDGRSGADSSNAGTSDAGTSDADAADAGPVTVVHLPQESDLPAATVVDVTDDAVAQAQQGADTQQDVVTQAVAQLPTQSTGESSVIDLASLEGADGRADDAPAGTTDESAGAPAADRSAATGTETSSTGTSTGTSTSEAATSEAGAAEATAAADVTAADLPAADVDAPVGAAVGNGAAGNGAAGNAATRDDDSDDAEQALDAAEDDLERIEGIGPRIASALRSAGIRSFRRLADADVPTLQAALEAAGLRFAPSLPTWSRQARFLADGDEVGFIKLTESLVAGREPGRSR